VVALATKYRVSATFDLSTQMEPEGVERRIESDVENLDGVTNFEGGSYFSSQEVTCDGGEVSFEIEADGEDDAESKLREAIDDGHEFEDDNGFTWVVEGLSVSTEAIEWEPTVEEAVEVLQEWIDIHLSDGDGDERGRVAKAAKVGLDDHTRLGQRVTSLESRVQDLDMKIAALSQRLQDVTPTQ